MPWTRSQRVRDADNRSRSPTPPAPIATRMHPCPQQTGAVSRNFATGASFSGSNPPLPTQTDYTTQRGVRTYAATAAPTTSMANLSGRTAALQQVQVRLTADALLQQQLFAASNARPTDPRIQPQSTQRPYDAFPAAAATERELLTEALLTTAMDTGASSVSSLGLLPQFAHSAPPPANSAPSNSRVTQNFAPLTIPQDRRIPTPNGDTTYRQNLTISMTPNTRRTVTPGAPSDNDEVASRASSSPPRPRSTTSTQPLLANASPPLPVDTSNILTAFRDFLQARSESRNANRNQQPLTTEVSNTRITRQPTLVSREPVYHAASNPSSGSTHIAPVNQYQPAAAESFVLPPQSNLAHVAPPAHNSPQELLQPDCRYFPEIGARTENRSAFQEVRPSPVPVTRLTTFAEKRPSPAATVQFSRRVTPTASPVAAHIPSPVAVGPPTRTVYSPYPQVSEPAALLRPSPARYDHEIVSAFDPQPYLTEAPVLSRPESVALPVNPRLLRPDTVAAALHGFNEYSGASPRLTPEDNTNRGPSVSFGGSGPFAPSNDANPCRLSVSTRSHEVDVLPGQAEASDSGLRRNRTSDARLHKTPRKTTRSPSQSPNTTQKRHHVDKSTLKKPTHRSGNTPPSSPSDSDSSDARRRHRHHASDNRSTKKGSMPPRKPVKRDSDDSDGDGGPRRPTNRRTKRPSHKSSSGDSDDESSDSSRSKSPLVRKSRGKTTKSSVKPPRPHAFSGKPDELVSWLDAYEVYAEAADLDPSEWTRQALPFMPDGTRDVLQFQKSSKRNQLPTFLEFKELMINQFLGVDPETLYMRLLDEMTQQPNELLLTYGMRFRRMLKMINTRTVLVKPVLAVTKFIAGLRDPQTKALLTRQRLADRLTFQQAKTEPCKSYLDDYIRLGRTCESSVDHLPPTPKTKSSAAAAMLVQASDEPEVCSRSTHQPMVAMVTPTPVSAAPFDMSEFVKSLAPLLAKQATQAAQALAPKPVQPPRQTPPSAPAPPAVPPTYTPPAPLPGGKDWGKVTCFNCNGKGHGASRCPDIRNDELILQRKARFDALRQAPNPRPAPGPPAIVNGPVAPAVQPPVGN